ncbi:MAG: serine O-acetyltransferase [Thermosynechococcaceae cyanobacterium]
MLEFPQSFPFTMLTGLSASFQLARKPTPLASDVPFSLGIDRLWSGLQAIASDFRIIFERDPAARNGLEVLLCYPGFHALVLHRFAHELHRLQLPVIPRLIAHIGRFLTGIEIHPGAAIGKGVFIDHGMGVVIGETAIVGDYTLIYQGATLGGTGKEIGKRHPTLGQQVVVGAGAKILGNIQIGDCVRIGAGSIVLRDVPSDCTVVGVPGRNLCRPSGPFCPLDHNQMPDAEATAIRVLLSRIEQLEQQLQTLSPTPISPLEQDP